MSDPVPPLAERAQSTLVDDIVSAVRERIVSGELSPGLKIRQQEFAEHLGVSRTPLREAFQRLESEGWVDLHARRGAEVRPLTVLEAEEIFTMRLVLETAMARISATVHSDADQQAAARLIDPLTTAGGTASALTGIEEANQRFHALIYGLDDSSLPRELSTMMDRYWRRALRYRRVYWRDHGAIDASRAAHLAIYEAWASRDADATERAVATHILVALHDIADAVDPTHRRSAALELLADRFGVQRPTPSTEVSP